MKQLLLYIIIGVALFALSACVSGADEQRTADGLGVGDPLPAFSVTLNDGRVVADTTLAGTPTLIAFFHTECPDCQRELPVLQQLYEQYGQRVDFVCIGREETDTAVAAYWQKNSLTMPWSAQKDRKVYNLFAQTYIPRIYLADKIGLIQAMFVEKVDREELDKVLMKVVQQP